VIAMHKTIFAMIAAAVTPAAALAAPADDVLQCAVLDYSACPALLQAAAARADAVTALAAVAVAADTAPDRRAKAAIALQLLDARDQKPALAKAAQLLEGKAEHIDVAAAQARLGDPAAIPALRQHLKSPDVRTQTLAAAGLGVVRAKEAVPDLMPLTEAAVQPRVQAAAAQALGHIGDPAAERALLVLASRADAYSPARAHALDALAAIGSRPGLALATLLVDASKRDVGRAALRVVQAVHELWAEPAVQFALTTPGLRAEGCKAAAAVRTKGLGRDLLALLEAPDLDADERLWLLHALGKIQPPGAGPAVLKKLKAEPPGQGRVLIVGALAEIGDRTVVPDLVQMLPDRDKRFVDHLVTTLEKLTGQNLGPDEPAWRRYAGLDKGSEAGDKLHPKPKPTP
jgi:HEAT repeat protein